jgi:hypothetical protein
MEFTARKGGCGSVTTAQLAMLGAGRRYLAGAEAVEDSVSRSAVTGPATVGHPVTTRHDACRRRQPDPVRPQAEAWTNLAFIAFKRGERRCDGHRYTTDRRQRHACLQRHEEGTGARPRGLSPAGSHVSPVPGAVARLGQLSSCNCGLDSWHPTARLTCRCSCRSRRCDGATSRREKPPRRHSCPIRPNWARRKCPASARPASSPPATAAAAPAWSRCRC